MIIGRWLCKLKFHHVKQIEDTFFGTIAHYTLYRCIHCSRKWDRIKYIVGYHRGKIEWVRKNDW